MSGHKHATDRVEGVIVAECPEGCDVSVTVEYGDAEDNEVLADLKKIIKNLPELWRRHGLRPAGTAREVLD